jgi:hypothetical protein
MLRPRQTGETVHSDDEWFVRRDGLMFPIAWWSALETGGTGLKGMADRATRPTPRRGTAGNNLRHFLDETPIAVEGPIAQESPMSNWVARAIS